MQELNYTEKRKTLRDCSLFYEIGGDFWQLRGTVLSVTIGPNYDRYNYYWWNDYKFDVKYIQKSICFREAFDLMPPEIKNQIIYHLDLFI